MIQKTHIYWSKGHDLRPIGNLGLVTIGHKHFRFELSDVSSGECETFFSFSRTSGVHIPESLARKWALQRGPSVCLSFSFEDPSNGDVHYDTVWFSPQISMEGFDRTFGELIAKAILLENFRGLLSSYPFKALMGVLNFRDWNRRRKLSPKENWKCETSGCLEMGYIKSGEQILCLSCLYAEQSQLANFFRHDAVQKDLWAWALSYLDVREAFVPRGFPSSDYDSGGYDDQDKRMDKLMADIRARMESDPYDYQWLHSSEECPVSEPRLMIGSNSYRFSNYQVGQVGDK